MSGRGANRLYLVPGALAVLAALVFDVLGVLAGGGAVGVVGGPAAGAAVDVGISAAYYLAGVLAYVLRPDNRAARLLLLTTSTVGVGKAIGDGLAMASITHPAIAHLWLAPVLLDSIGWLALATGLSVFAVFPDGRYQRRYECWTVRLAIFALVPLQLARIAGSPRLLSSQFSWLSFDAPNPFHLAGLEPLGTAADGVLSNGSLILLAGVALLVLRFRRFDPEQRRQAQWPLLAVGLSALSFVSLAVMPAPPAIPFWLAATQYLVTQALLPAGLAIGIVRHRSSDIDFVIRRSLVYGVLWVLIALLYVVVAAGFGIALGQRVPLALAVVVTIVASLLFQPARRRLERVADRLVFGPRLTGYELISRLGVRLQSSAAAEDVAGSVAGAVQTGLGARWVRVALNRPERTPLAAAGIRLGEDASPALAAPLVHGEQVVGMIECGPKVDGRYDAADQELLTTLGRQAALAIRNSQLSAELSDRLEELAASRVRLVQAEEAGRRRLERDLHDGVQQELVGVLARLGLARNQLRRDRELAEATLREAQVDARRALESLQELARGIHPAILTDRGLVEAVEERATRMPLPVEVEVETDGAGREMRFPVELEGAAYFFVSEALANVLKYAAATRVHVRFHSKPERLAIEVEDDGRGFDPGAAKLSGLRGLKDRIEALGGQLEVVSRPGRGTVLRASLPLPEPARV